MVTGFKYVSFEPWNDIMNDIMYDIMNDVMYGVVYDFMHDVMNDMYDVMYDINAILGHFRVFVSKAAKLWLGQT